MGFVGKTMTTGCSQIDHLKYRHTYTPLRRIIFNLCSSLCRIQAFSSSEGVPPVEACALVDGLKTALRTRAHSFVLRFIKQGGLTALLEALQRAPRDDALTWHNLIAAIKALMNNSVSVWYFYMRIYTVFRANRGWRCFCLVCILSIEYFMGSTKF